MSENPLSTHCYCSERTIRVLQRTTNRKCVRSISLSINLGIDSLHCQSFVLHFEQEKAEAEITKLEQAQVQQQSLLESSQSGSDLSETSEYSEKDDSPLIKASRTPHSRDNCEFGPESHGLQFSGIDEAALPGMSGLVWLLSLSATPFSSLDWNITENLNIACSLWPLHMWCRPLCSCKTRDLQE